LTTNLTNHTNKARLPNEALDARLRRAAEIDQKAKPQAGGVQIVEHLRTMLRRKFPHGFELQDDGVEANEVGPLGLKQRLSLVGDRQRLLCDKWNLPLSQFNG
jgi:hypothetical protein